MQFYYDKMTSITMKIAGVEEEEEAEKQHPFFLVECLSLRLFLVYEFDIR